MLLFVEILIREDEHRMLVVRPLDGGEGLVVDLLRDVDAENFGAQRRAEATNGQRHFMSPVTVCRRRSAPCPVPSRRRRPRRSPSPSHPPSSAPPTRMSTRGTYRAPRQE